ncbi:MAG: hypothetical protein N3B21_19515 [Clostridia bacterium]|nr:hypothetical protein [Clostridia bacterium]
MASLVDDIKKQAKEAAKKESGGYRDPKSAPRGHSKESLVGGTEALIIEQKLNKAFYATPNYPEELRMIKMQKMQAQQQGDRYGLHCSAIITSENEFCYREQLLSLFYRQAQGENIPIGLKRIFQEGSMLGEKWQRLFVSSGLGKKEDMDISRFLEKYDLSYTPDARIYIGDEPWVVEIKSMNHFQFQKATSHPSGRKQLRMYMFFERIKRGFVLVENKNDQQFKVFPEIYGETFTKEDIMPYIERLERIQVYKREFIEDKKMVDRHPKCTSATCKMAQECNMRDACFNVGMGRVKLNVRND